MADTNNWNKMFTSEDCWRTDNYRVIPHDYGLGTELHKEFCAGIEKCLPGKKIGPVKRTGYHLHAILSGTGWLRAGEKETTISEGQLFLVVPEEEMEYCADKKNPWYYCWITFDGTKAKEWVELAGFSEGVFVQNSNVEITRFLEIVKSMLAHPRMAKADMIYNMGKVYEFLSLAIESAEIGNQGMDRGSSWTKVDYVDFAIKFLDQNYASATISQLAEYTGLSRRYLSQIFKDKMCMSPQEYLMNVRMEKARGMLETTEYSIKSIAENLGYENGLSFSKVFKRQFRISPEKYRELVCSQTKDS